MRRVRLISLAVLMALAPEIVRAQWQLTGDVGVSRLRQQDIPTANAATFGAAFEAIGDRAWFRSGVLAAGTAGAGWTRQGVAVGSFVLPGPQLARWEFSGVVSGFDETNSSSTNSTELMARIHFPHAEYGSAFGLGGGRVNQQGLIAGLAHAQADAWRIVGNNRFVGTISYVNSPRPRTPFTPVGRSNYADISGGWRYEVGGLSVGTTGGGRTGEHSYWASGDATLWFAPQAALALSVGRSLQDVTRGIPQTRYASISLRISARPHATLWSRSSRPSGPVITATRERIEVRVDSASTVEVMGDFTDWQPVSLNRDGKAWCLSRSLMPGLHRIKLRIDGGEWMIPSNLPRETDDLGGTIAIITIP